MLLRFILTVFCFNLLFTQTLNAYQELWKAPQLELAEDDHWKHQPIKKLPDDFLLRLLEVNQRQFRTLEEVRIAAQLLTHDQGIKEVHNLVRTGDFVYNEQLLLGHGEEGRVCLAQHIPTGSYVAMKRTGRRSEFEAFKNLGRCFGCYQKDDRYFIYTPLIMGTPLSSYSIHPGSLLEMEVNVTGNIVYKNWLLNLRLIDAYLAEIQRCVRREGIPQEYDTNSMFVTGESLPDFQVIFVDLDTGAYRPQDKDLIPDVFCIGLKYLLGSKIGGINDEFIFPAPIAKFFKNLDSVTGGYIRITKLFDLRRNLEREMIEFQRQIKGLIQ